jgi:hypothetical protein
MHSPTPANWHKLDFSAVHMSVKRQIIIGSAPAHEAEMVIQACAGAVSIRTFALSRWRGATKLPDMGFNGEYSLWNLYDTAYCRAKRRQPSSPLRSITVLRTDDLSLSATELSGHGPGDPEN